MAVLARNLPTYLSLTILNKRENYQVVHRIAHKGGCLYNSRRIKGWYYFRMRVPSDVRSITRKAEIKVSLRTRNSETARMLSNAFRFKIDKVCSLYRCGVIDYEQLTSQFESLIPHRNKQLATSAARTAKRQDLSNNRVLLSQVMEEFLSEMEKNWKSCTRQENRKIFRRALQIIGDKDITTLRRSDFVDYSNVLRCMPPNHEKMKEYVGKTPVEIVQMVKEKNKPTISAKTYNKDVMGISTLMKWCVDTADYINKNYAKGLAVDEEESERWEPYSIDELRTLLQSPLYLPTKVSPEHSPEQFWIPLIGMFSGMRLNEICSLYVEDIKIIDGVLCFDVNANRNDKMLKNKSSKRAVPVHPKLIEIGLLTYIADVKNKNQTRLFPQLVFSKNHGGYAGAFGKWYARYKRKYIPDKRKVFHSFRKNAANTLKQANVEKNKIEEILGHKDYSMSTGYYAKHYEMPILYEAIQKLNYEGVDFSRIRFPFSLHPSN